MFKCPICKAPVDEPTAEKRVKYFPFCSERCKLVDLGRWLDGKYQIPVEISPDEDENVPPVKQSDPLD